MSCDDGLVMTLHPGVRRNHHPATFARFGADTGHDIPVAVEFTNALQPLLERYGTHPNLHLVLFTLDATCSAARSRRWPGSTRRSTPARRGGSWTSPSEIRSFQHSVTEIAGLTKAFRVHRRHPRVLLDPGPARHVPPARRRLPGRAGRRAPARRGRGAGQPHPTWSPTNPERCSSCDRLDSGTPHAARKLRLSRAGGDAGPAAPVRIVHLGLGNFFRAHQAWYTDHAPDAAEWGIAAFTGRSAELADGAHRAGRPLHADHPRPPTATPAEVVGSVVRRPPRPRHARLARTTWPTPRSGSSPSPSPRPATSAAPTAVWTPNDPMSGAMSTALRRDPRGAGADRAGPAGRRARRPPRRRRRPARRGVLRQPARQRRRDRPGGRAISPACSTPSLAGWIDDNVSFVTTMVDRITPATTARTTSTPSPT